MTVDWIPVWVVAAGAAILLLAFGVHLLMRGAVRTREERMRDLEGQVLYALQSGTLADELVVRLRRAPQDLARHALAHTLRTLGEPCRNYLTYVYEQLALSAYALNDLKARSPLKRATAALELGAFRRADAIPACIDLLGDRHLEARLAATRALCDIGTPETVRPILESVPYATRWAISDTVQFIRSLGAAVAPTLVTVVAESHSRHARLTAIEALGEMGYGDACATLEPFLADPDMEFRIFATRALGRIGGSSEALGRAMKDSSWQVRAVAARAGGASKTPAAVTQLEGALSDAAWWVRQNAAEALLQQEKPGEDSLRKNLKSTDSFVHDAAAQAAQQIPPENPA